MKHRRAGRAGYPGPWSWRWVWAPARLALLACALAWGPAWAAAQPGVEKGAAEKPGGKSAATAAPRPHVNAVRLTERVAIDGVLSEAVWRQADACTSFLQRSPREGAPATLRTEVRVAYDDDAIYVGARMYDPAPDSIMARLSRRDASISADRFAVYLDPYHDRRTGYYFMVNAAGTLYDGTLSNDVSNDKSWDGVWSARAAIDAQGWVAEMRLPYSQMRIDRAGSPTWGINFARTLPRRREEAFVAYRPRKESGFVSRFPELKGLTAISPGPALELMPYAATRNEFLSSRAGDPFNDGSRLRHSYGGDIRLGIASRLTLNASILPDFGQVEVDPADVNLTDVETFLEEKRPFFVEGASTFEFGRQGAGDYWDYRWEDPLFFYSRRIGREPQGRVPSATYRDVPDGSQILGAVKLTGRLTQGWNFGTLHAVTDREMAKLSRNGTHWKAEIEPLTYYGVARGQREFADRRFGFGMLGTGTIREFDDPALQNQLARSAFLAGLDGWAFLDRKKTWVVSGWSAGTYVSGNEAQMIRLQRNSTHYFQRPDAVHLGVDSSRTSLPGRAGRIWINKEKGATQFNAAYGTISPGFEANDLGYLRYGDLRNAHIGTGYKWTRPGRLRRYQTVKAALFGSWDHGGSPLSRGIQASGYTELMNDLSWSYYAQYRPGGLDHRRSRGGPLMRELPQGAAGIVFQTDTQHRFYYYFGVDGSWSESGSSYLNAYPSVEWKPTPAFNVKVGPGIERIREDAQFVESRTDPSSTGTYGTRYVFGSLDQTTVYTSLRINWTFSPRLSFESYVRPYISTADYSGFKKLTRARSYDFTPHEYTGNPDLTVRSLKGDAIVRWEYRPGSVLFLVWTQRRANQDSAGEFDLPTSFDQMTKLKPDNVYLVKLSYYFGM